MNENTYSQIIYSIYFMENPQYGVAIRTNSTLTLVSSTATLAASGVPEQPPKPNRWWSIRNKIKHYCSYITVEPILCCYSLPYILAGIALQNLTLQMACKVNLGYNTSVCNDLLYSNATSNVEMQVQKEVAKLLIWKRPLSTVMPAFLIMFMGSYSDRYKIRKPFLLIPLVGDFLATIGYIFCTIYQDSWPIESTALFETLFPALTGGLTTIKMATYSYVSDVSTLDMRTTRLGIVQVVSNIMSPVGNFLSGVMFRTTGYYGVFCTRMILHLFALWYGCVFIREPAKKTRDPTKNICVDFFDPKNVWDTFSVLFRKQTGQSRLKIVLLMLAFILVKGSGTGESDMLFLYTRLRFQWDSITYGFYTTYDVLVRLIGSTVAITLFTQHLKLDDCLIAPLTIISKLLSNIMYAFAPSPLYLYIASVIGLMSEYQTVPIRSIATKLVSPDDAGKIQSLFGICEAIAPSVYGPLYSSVYRATVEVMPGAFYLVGAASLVPTIPVFLGMYLIRENKSRKDHETQSKTKFGTFRYIAPMGELFM